MIHSLALELAPKGITVNGVAPGFVETAVDRAALAAAASSTGINIEDERAKRNAGIPLRRQADPREVADAMLFLSSPQASYITGTVLDINGGMLLR